MVKRTITAWWIVGAAVIVIGVTLAIASSIALVPYIQDVTGGFRHSFVPDSFFWTTISLIVLGCIAVVVGIAAQFVAWIGAVINTNRLEDKAWFNVMLWGGIVGLVISLLFGLGALFWWGVMISYLIAGPDGIAAKRAQIETPAEPPKTLVPAA